MLLPFRWLFYGTATETTGGTRVNRKIQRKLRRLAQWTEAIAPARVDVVAPVQGIALRAPRLAPVRVSVSNPVSSISPALRLASPKISIAAPLSPVSIFVSVADLTVEAGIDLFDYEIAALMAA